jgi:hypothetical protein
VQWRIPGTFWRHIDLTKDGAADVLRLKIPEISMGQRGTAVPLFRDVRVNALTTRSFPIRLEGVKQAYTIGSKLLKTDKTMFGLDLYQSASGTQPALNNAYFFPAKEGEYYAKCLLPAGQKLETESGQGTCTIGTHIRNLLQVEYSIAYRDMPRIQDVNDGIVRLLESYMIN